jgi:hypothetical protein
LGGGLNDEFEALLASQTGSAGSVSRTMSAVRSPLCCLTTNRWINVQHIGVASGYII